MLQRHHHHCSQRSSLRAMNPFTLSKDGVGGRKEVRKEVNMRGVGEARRVGPCHLPCARSCTSHLLWMHAASQISQC